MLVVSVLLGILPRHLLCPADMCVLSDSGVCVVQILSNSYAFAYFFFGNGLYSDEFDEDQNKVNQNLFEDSQEMLAAEVRTV